MGYNGWTNYETWVCTIWMDNDEGESEYWQERARRNRDEYSLSEELRSYYDERMNEMIGKQSGFFVDILSAALHDVNWYEIAEHLIEETKEEMEEEGV